MAVARYRMICLVLLYSSVTPRDIQILTGVCCRSGTLCRLLTAVLLRLYGPTGKFTYELVCGKKSFWHINYIFISFVYIRLVVKYTVVDVFHIIFLFNIIHH